MLGGVFGAGAAVLLGVLFLVAGPSGAASVDEQLTVGERVPNVVIGVPATVAEAEPDAEADGDTTPDPDEAAPDPDEAAADLVATLRRSPAIAWVADDQMAGDTTQILVAYEEGSEPAARRAIDLAIADQLREASGDDDPVNAETAAELVASSDYTISGRDVTDAELLGRIGVGAALVVAVASVVIGALVTLRVGSARGALAGVTLAVGTWLAGEIGEAVAGPFDGSLATTALPAVLGGVVVASYLVVRLLVWFETPHGDDQADVIRQAVTSVGFELFLLFASLGIAALFLELLAPARSIATVTLVGALAAAVFTLAVVPPVLTVIGLPRDPWWEPLPIPAGRDVPIVVLIGFAVFLTALGFFAFRSTSDAQLLDERALGADSEAVAGTRDLLARGGDPTSAILVELPNGVDQLERSTWLEQVSQLEWVARVDTSTGRYEAGAFTQLEGIIGPSPSPSAGTDDADEAAERRAFALIVPGVTGRSEAAVDLVGAVEAIDTGFDATLSGPTVEGREAADGDQLMVWLTAMALAAMGGVAVFALIPDLRLAGIAAAIRLVGLAGAAGLYHLLVGDVSGQEIQLALLVIGLGAGLFELGFLRHLTRGRRVVDTDSLVDGALGVEGTAATVAMALTAISALALLVPDLAILRRFGILLAVVILIETVVGIWLLRPVMLGTRAVSQLAARPVKIALESLQGSRVSSQAEHRAWVDVIIELLEAEFGFQADPAAADISEVFVADTALYVSSRDHHQNLADAGLRIVGRPPQLRALRVVSNSAPATLVVTVDHPARQLVDDRNKVVGVRQAERRSVMLWMIMFDDGTYRIADSVELGALPLPSDEQPAPVEPAVTVASS